MTDELLTKFLREQSEQQNRNQARKIRSLVDKAKRNPHTAGFRWPFELLQNALDPGPRPGRNAVKIRIVSQDSHLIFEHDGALFSLRDLAALLSGGSSKEYDAEDTSGRFGTGFLVTHVLAERTRLQGLLTNGPSVEQFDLLLDRMGDEEAILANIESCNEGIRLAQSVTRVDETPTASFEYLTSPGDTPLDVGLAEFRRALPYLFATWPILGTVTLEVGDAPEKWEPASSLVSLDGDDTIQYRDLHIEKGGGELSRLRVYRFKASAEARASALVLTRSCNEGWETILPEPNAPRVYRDYPLRQSHFLPLQLVLNGTFQPDEDRARFSTSSEEDKAVFGDALSAAVLAVEYSAQEGWVDAYRLAEARKPNTCFDPTDEDELVWWTKQMEVFASRVARLPLVECAQGLLPAVSDKGSFADFVFPRLLSTSPQDETTVERMLPLMEATIELYPPLPGNASNWTQIAEGWAELGVEVCLRSVKDLGQWARKDATDLTAMKVNGNAAEWIASYIDLVGECWSRRKGVDLSTLERLVPNQNGRLCSPKDLRRDGGITEDLKDISRIVGKDARERLLTTDLHAEARAEPLQYLENTIEEAVPDELSEDDVIAEVIECLDEALPEDELCPQDSEAFQECTATLLSHLWYTKGLDGASFARQVPLVTLGHETVRWTATKRLVSPVQCWPESARPFSEAYPSDRVLSEIYGFVNSQDGALLVSHLVNWDMAHAAPIIKVTLNELSDKRVKAFDPTAGDGNVATDGESFSQIALLSPDVLLHCQQDEDAAKALLGLVLCHVAPSDSNWRDERPIVGRRGGSAVCVKVRGALWWADLKVRAWVPMKGEGDKIETVSASAGTLAGLLDAEWLKGNNAAVELLVNWFDFNELDLRLMGVADSDQQRRALQDGLAKIVAIGGADVGFYANLAHTAEAQQRRARDVNRGKQFGLAVQGAIRTALEQRHLTLDLVDRGYDYDVIVPNESVLEEGGTRFDVGHHLLEVKATTSGEVKMTPLQAKTASEEASRYVLCVVDLRGISEADMDADWEASDVEPMAHIVTDIGDQVAVTYEEVDRAMSADIPIRNESSLRYGVSTEIWEKGVDIANWVASLSNTQ